MDKRIQTTFKKIKHGHETYIFNGQGSLIYKRWGSIRGRTFHEGEGAGEKEYFKENNK